MIIAHLPSGYVLARCLLRWLPQIPARRIEVIWAGLLGGFAPDFDMLWFHLIDHRQTHHHKYFSHWPILWLSLTALSSLWILGARRSKTAWLTMVFSLGGVLHVILDSLVGDIWWLAPFIDQPYALFTVPARFSPWWLNFVLHWSFAVELAICAWAVVLMKKKIVTPATP